jgi:chitin synthase
LLYVRPSLPLSSDKERELTTRHCAGQVPCYTEGEESLKKTIDSLAVLNYDDKRKLIFIICDGMIVGAGNDRPTPRIVLDILGVDQTVDPDPLMFKSVAEGSKQLNYGKVWSGLYEVEGRGFESLSQAIRSPKLMTLFVPHRCRSL